MKLSFKKLYWHWPDFLPLITLFFCPGMSSPGLSGFPISYFLTLKSILMSPTRLAAHSRQHCWFSTLNSGSLCLSQQHLRVKHGFLSIPPVFMAWHCYWTCMCLCFVYMTLFLAQSPRYACKSTCWLNDTLVCHGLFWKINEGLRPDFL